jgi:hypothetical protein
MFQMINFVIHKHHVANLAGGACRKPAAAKVQGFVARKHGEGAAVSPSGKDTLLRMYQSHVSAIFVLCTNYVGSVN